MAQDKKFFFWQGRAARLEYWLIQLGSIPVTLAIVALAVVLTGSDVSHLGLGEPDGVAFPTKVFTVGIVAVAWWLNLMVGIRRLHDRNKSGWWLLVGLIPVLGVFWMLIECGFKRGTDGDNRFGPSPLAAKG